ESQISAELAVGDLVHQIDHIDRAIPDDLVFSSPCLRDRLQRLEAIVGGVADGANPGDGDRTQLDIVDSHISQESHHGGLKVLLRGQVYQVEIVVPLTIAGVLAYVPGVCED